MADNKLTNTMMIRAVSFVPSSINEEQRTVDVVFSTSTPVAMSSWRLGQYIETLSHDKEHLRMKRLEAGVPVLDNHNQWGGTRGVLGVLENVRIEGGKGTGTIRFSKRGDDYVEGVWTDIKDGILRGISAGYRVYKYEDMNPDRKADETPQYRAIDWEIFEVSIAPIQADVNSAVRSEKAEENDVEILTTRSATTTTTTQPDNNMAEEIKPNGGAGEDQNRSQPPAPAAPAAQPAAPVDVEQVRKEAATAERNRVAEITASVRKLKLGDDFAQELIRNGTPIEQARQLIIDKFAEADPNAGQRNVTVQQDEADKRRAGMTDALVLRAAPELASDAKVFTADRVAAANEFRGLTLLDIARESLERLGVNTRGMDKMTMVGRAFTQTGSDLPVLLEGTNRRVLLAAYTTVADTWRRFCATGSVSDFRAWSRLRYGTLGNLDLVGEGSEFKRKNIPDASKESISIKTKGNIIAVTRQMIINDDLSGLTRLATMLGRSAARSIEADVYALLLSNSGNGPTMGDGQPLFHASHGNIGTGAALSVSSIDADRVLMAQQMDPNTNDYIGLLPSILLLPIGLGGAARVINAAQYDTEVSNKFQVPNKVVGLYRDIVDTPRLTGTTRYSFADPNEEPVIEVAFLDGQQSPYLESKQGWEIDGTEWKVRLDYGVGAIGWRGVVRNAGA